MKILIILYLMVITLTCNADPELWFNEELAVKLEKELIDSVERINEQNLIPVDVAENIKNKNKMWYEFPNHKNGYWKIYRTF